MLRAMETTFKRRYAPFQIKIAETILDNFLDANGQDIYIEVARQAGKTTVVTDTVSMLSMNAKSYIGIDANIGVFAPQKEQSKTDFDRFKENLKLCQKNSHITADFAEANSNTIRLHEGIAELYSFSLEHGTNIEGKSNSLQIFEEAQKIHGPKEKKMKIEAFPMAAAYNAPRIFIGSGGYHLCYFYKGIQENKNNPRVLHRYPYQQIIEEKKWLYNKTLDPFHLRYAEFIAKEKDTLGEFSDEFKSQYELVWNLERGMFVTKEAFMNMRLDQPFVKSEHTYPCFAGVDVGKKHDSSVVSVVRFVKGKWVRLAFKMWQGDNYSMQFKEMLEFLSNYNIHGMAIDSTGQGDWLPDRFDDETEYSPIHYTFTASSKDKLYKNALSIFDSGNFRWLTPDNKYYIDQNLKQYTELEKEHKGEYLSVHHPDNDKEAHDDIPDADALALWAGAEYYGNGITSGNIDVGDNFYENIYDEDDDRGNQIIDYEKS